MTASRIPLRRRAVGAVVAALALLVGGIATGSAAGATGQLTCPTTSFTEAAGGWVKYDGLQGTTYTYPQKAGFTVAQVCYKAATTVSYPAATGTITSTVTNCHGAVQEISHVSVRYVPRPRPDEPAPVVTVESFSAAPSCEVPTVLAGTVTTTTGWVFDVGSWSWVAGTPVVTDGRAEVSLTEAELAACEPVEPPKPDPVVTVESFTAAPSCATPTVLAGTVTTTTDWVFDAETSTWVAGTPTVVDDRAEVSLTAAERAACTPTQPTVPTVPTQPNQPARPLAAAPVALAATGSSAVPPALTVLGLLLLGAAAVLGRRRLQA